MDQRRLFFLYGSKGGCCLVSPRAVAVFLVLLAATFSYAQLSPDRIAALEADELFLRTAQVVGERQLSEEEGITLPYCLTLEDENGRRARALWKNPFGKMYGFWEGWQYEIAAYRFDRLLDLGMVPPTVERSFKSKNGSCQFWLEDTLTGQQMHRNETTIPGERVEGWTRALALQEAFDNLIGNEDRITRNVLVTPDFRLIMIDHSRSFRRTRRWRRKLPFDQPSAMQFLPRTFVERVRKLDFDTIRQAVGGSLTDQEITAVLARRELVLKRIAEMIKERGEEKVLY